MTLKKSITTVPFEFKLQQALCFYHNNKAHQKLAVMFDCHNGELVDPQPFSGDQVRDLIPDNEETRTIYLPNTLYYSSDRMVWWRKESKRTLKIVGTEKLKGKEKADACKFHLPGLVFKVHRCKLYIASLGYRNGGKYNLNPDSMLYNHPFRGIDVHDGAVGMCNVVKPKQQRMQDRDEWENAFFKSKFNQAPKLYGLGIAPMMLSQTLSEFTFQ